MAQNVETPNKTDGNLGLKVKGDLGDFQIIEERSDTEDDGDDNSDDDDDEEPKDSNGADNALSILPANLINSSITPVFGSVQVTGSENVQFGNNTYFNGPVTIKQIISNQLGVDNACYTKTEEEDLKAPQDSSEPKDKNSASKSFQWQLWHKVTFSALIFIILGGICGVLALVLPKNSQDDSGTTSFTDDSSKSKGLVAGLCYENIYQLFIFTILLPLTLLLVSYSLLTKEAGISAKSSVSKGAKNKKHPNDFKYNNFVKRYNYAEDPLLIGPNHLRIVSRTDWLAQPVEKELDKIRQPVPWVIITHTATESCTTQSECVLRVRLIQMFHIESRKWFDIGYNFLVAGDGSAYYGRGWDYIGAHTLGYNKYSIGIAFIGTFNNEAPPKKQIEACEKLIKRGVELGKLAKDYKLFAHRQLSSTLSPGDKLFDIIKEWPHFVKNITDISSLIPDY